MDGNYEQKIQEENPSVDSFHEMLILARSYRSQDPHSAMLYCRRALEAIVHHLTNTKFPNHNHPNTHLAKRIKTLDLESPNPFFSVNRITSYWIHWSPEKDRDISEIDKCIRLLTKILKTEFASSLGEKPNEFSILDYGFRDFLSNRWLLS